MVLSNIIEPRKEAFMALCQHHRVRYLFAFGSAVHGAFREGESDIDLIVEVDYQDPVEKGSALISLWDTLEDFFGTRVDLLTENSVRNPYLKQSIDSTKKLIYDGQSQKILI